MTEDTAFVIDRTPINLSVGSYVLYLKDEYKITEVIDFYTVIGRSVTTGRLASLMVKELKPACSNYSSRVNIDLTDVGDDDWKTAQHRYTVIQPLLKLPIYGRKDVEARAEEMSVNTATIYRWLKLYIPYGHIIALVPRKRGRNTGSWQIEFEREKLLSTVINDYYLTKQRPSIQATVVEVERQAKVRGVKPPSASTVRKRIMAIPEKDTLWKRGQKEKAKNKFTPAAGKFPNADYPLAVIQIDHTPLDIILVDDEYRLPIGRPWLTLAMDIHTRMIVGYYIAFDEPSETSVGMCMAHSMLPKEEWLATYDVQANWPVWGKPATVHVDNGADFRSDNFKRACGAYGINLEFRPVRAPRYGGHIERVLGTFVREVHRLPGTTFSSIKERDNYDSEKHATLTKSEFETWFVNLVCRVYHNRKHDSLGISPLQMWERSVFGDAESPGVGMPPRFADSQKLILDFMPTVYRTVQTFGVKFEGLLYYAESLRHKINAIDPQTKKKQKFIFRFDPRDISKLWFYDPELKQYFPIPYADQSIPKMSLWELKLVKTKLRNKGTESINKHQVLDALTDMRNVIDSAAKSTKRARKQLQKRKEHEKKSAPLMTIDRPKSESGPLITHTFPNPDNLNAENPLGLLDDIDEYGDIC